MLTVVARALKTPDRHTGCGNKEQPVRRSPMRNAALRRARFVVPRRRPRRPRHRPRQQSCHVLCSIPRRSLPTRCRRDAPTRRHMHRANAWRRLVPGQPDCVGLPRCRASLDFFESLTGSPQALSAAITALRAIRRHAVGVTRQNVAAGHFLLPGMSAVAFGSAEAETVLPSSLCELRRDKSHWFSGYHPHARKRKR